MIIKMNSPTDSPDEGRSDERRSEISRLVDHTDLELVELRALLSTITTDDTPACERYEGFARRLARGCESAGLGVLQAIAADLLALVEHRTSQPTPTAKFRFLLFTALELIAIELSRIRSASAN